MTTRRWCLHGGQDPGGGRLAERDVAPPEGAWYDDEAQPRWGE